MSERNEVTRETRVSKKAKIKSKKMNERNEVTRLG
jgi:hypothetical protein